MNDIFTPPSTDLSLQYLVDLFGPVYVGSGTCVINSGNCESTTTLLGSLFNVFNLAVLAIAVLGAVYFTVVGIVSTAHEGEMMGKKYNNLWIPIRMVMGIAMMVPTSAGYSFIQVVMLWVVVNGIGAADTLWQTGLNYIQTNQSIYAQVNMPSTGLTSIMSGLFQGMVCDESAKISQPDPQGIGPQNSFCSQNGNNPFCNSDTAFNAYSSGTASVTSGYNNVLVTAGSTGTAYSAKPSYVLGPGGACGAISYCDQNSDSNDSTGACNTANGGTSGMACTTCKAQIQELGTVISTLRPIAHQFAQADWQYRDFYANSYNSGNGPITPSGNYQWLSTYCNSVGVPTDQCCIPQAVGNPCQQPLPQPNPNNPTPTNLYPNFPNPTNSNVPQSASDSVIQTILWPFSVQTISGSNPVAMAANDYQSALQSAITNYQNANQNGSGNNNLSGQLATMAQGGWIAAGSYYMTIASMNGSNQQQALPAFAFVPPSPAVTMSGSTLYNTRNNYVAATTLMQLASGGSANGSPLGSIPGGSMLNGIITGPTNTTSTTSGGNPIANIISNGQSQFTTAIAIWATVFAVTPIIAPLAYIDPMVLGNGISQNPGVGAVNAIQGMLFPQIMLICAINTSYGAIQAVYIPLIPFIIFVTAAIGWLISVVEALASAPIVALGIMSPSGQHEFLGKAEAGMMLLFGIFLKPPLMIIGLFAGMLIASAVVGMVNTMWGTITGAIGGTSNIIGGYVFQGAQIMLEAAIISKAFSIIYMLPNEVLTWIGGQAGREGAEALHEVKGGVERGAGFGEKQMATAESTQKAGTEIAGRGGQLHGARRKQQSDEESKLNTTPSPKQSDK